MCSAVRTSAIVWLAALAPLVAHGEEVQKSAPAKPVVAVFRLHGAVTETPSDGNPFSFFGSARSTSLQDLVVRMNKARDDAAVKAVVLSLDGAAVAMPQVEELRQALAALRRADKPVYAFADGLSMQEYALVAGATQISVVPTGDLWLTGFYSESPYLRGLLDKIGVTPDFLTCGDYKSAAETFMRSEPSPQADEMQNWLLDSMYRSTIKLIATGRGIDEAKVREWIDGGPYTADRAQQLGIIDKVQQRDQLEAALKERYGEKVKFDAKYGAKSSGQMDFSSPMGIMSFYADLLGGGKKKKSNKDAIAIVHVEGEITLGTAEASPFSFGGTSASSTAIRRALDEVAADDSVKAVVLRVDSPGGSATASDIILAATRRVKAKKPLVVSMGNVAGSGGYYVACASDLIFADETTITGSIGVVGGKLATTGLWNKVGIRWKAYERGANAAVLSTAQPFTPQQRERMQQWMDEIYGVFKGHVTAIRGDRLKKPIDELAGGRVYTGQQALELGLVDRIGTLADAIKFVAGQAAVEKYELRTVPEPKNFLESLFEGLSGEQDDEKGVSSTRGAVSARSATLLEAALPYFQGFDPQRLGAATAALRRLEMLHRDGVVLMMPEIVFGR